MRAEFCIFESNAPGLKANFYEPYVDMPSRNASCWEGLWMTGKDISKYRSDS